MASRKSPEATKKVRRNRSDAEKQEIARQAILALRADEKWNLSVHARKVGVYESLLRNWMNDFGKPYGWKGSVRSYDRSKPAPEALSVPVEGVTLPPSDPAPALTPPASAWAEKFGGELREAMGIEAESTSSGTLVSSGEPKKKSGRPTNAEVALRKEREAAERELARSGAGLSRIAFYPRPRRVTVTPPEDDRQPGLFDHHGQYRAEPVQREQEPSPPQQSGFMDKVTAEALRERDAVLTTLKILMRDGGLPGPR